MAAATPHYNLLISAAAVCSVRLCAAAVRKGLLMPAARAAVRTAAAVRTVLLLLPAAPAPARRPRRRHTHALSQPPPPPAASRANHRCDAATGLEGELRLCLKRIAEQHWRLHA